MKNLKLVSKAKVSQTLAILVSLAALFVATVAKAQYEAVCTGEGRDAYVWQHGGVYSARVEKTKTKLIAGTDHVSRKGYRLDCENIQYLDQREKTMHEIQCTRYIGISFIGVTTHKIIFNDDLTSAALYDYGLKPGDDGYEKILKCSPFQSSATK